MQQDPIELLRGESSYTFVLNVFVWLDTLGLAKYKCIAAEKREEEEEAIRMAGGYVLTALPI